METVLEGSKTIEWTIRRELINELDEEYFPDGHRYDWIIDDGRGGYEESDMFFKSAEEAKVNLGV